MNDPKSFNVYRVKSGPLATTDDAGPNGAFVLANKQDKSFILVVTVSQNGQWTKVTVSKQVNKLLGKPVRVDPSQADMQTVKQVFFKPEETCWEYYPHDGSALHSSPGFRHLWHNTIRDIPIPEHKVTKRRELSDN